MSDLADFLAARLDEDGRAARESHYEGQRWLTEEEGVYRWPGDEPVHLADRKADARHIARHDPARALREVGAKRAILVEYQRLNAAYLAFKHGANQASLLAIQTAVELLAAVYADHPDYDPGWAPAVRIPG